MWLRFLICGMTIALAVTAGVTALAVYNERQCAAANDELGKLYGRMEVIVEIDAAKQAMRVVYDPHSPGRWVPFKDAVGGAFIRLKDE